MLRLWDFFVETPRPEPESRGRFVDLKLAPLGVRGVDGGLPAKKFSTIFTRRVHFPLWVEHKSVEGMKGA